MTIMIFPQFDKPWHSEMAHTSVYRLVSCFVSQFILDFVGELHVSSLTYVIIACLHNEFQVRFFAVDHCLWLTQSVLELLL